MAAQRLAGNTMLRDETRAFLHRITAKSSLDVLNYVKNLTLSDDADGAVRLTVEFYVDPQFMDGKP